jgi:hypothetical protein
MGAVFVLAAAAMIGAGRGRQAAPWIAVAAAVAFLVTPLSAPVWGLSTLLDRVQFPWRVLTVFDVAVCMLLALVLDARIRWTPTVARLMAVAVLLLTAQLLLPQGVLSDEARPAAREDARIAFHADAVEYLPSCRPLMATDPIIDGTSQRIVERALADRGDGVLPVLYYPFLAVLADGIEVPAACDPGTGLIRADVPDGAAVEIRKSTLPAERAGYAISALSLVILAACLPWRRRRALTVAAEIA